MILSCKEQKTATAPALQNAENAPALNTDIDIPTAKNMIAQSPEIVLLDVRTPEG